MAGFYSNLVPSNEVLKILKDYTKFETWMKTVHPSQKLDEIFSGYKFSVVCCLNTFIDALSWDEILLIENDFLFERGLIRNIELEKMQNSCPKVILLKNIKPYYDDVTRSSTYAELENALANFRKNIGLIFDNIIDKHVVIRSTNEDFDKQKVIHYSCIEFTIYELTAINNNGPGANTHNPFNTEWMKDKEWDDNFVGYKYTLEFVWNILLGEEAFRKTKLSNLHSVDSWRDSQNCIDNYCGYILSNIWEPIESKYKLKNDKIRAYYKFTSVGYDDQVSFKSLLISDHLTDPFDSLSWTEKIENKLYWFHYDVINRRYSQIYQETSFFNTLLAGAIELHKKRGNELSKVLVVKFIHPRSEDGKENNYSYGVLIDSYSASISNDHGWVICQDACGDFSGHSGAEYKLTEKMLSDYIKADKIELRELVIPYADFADWFKANEVLDASIEV